MWVVRLDGSAVNIEKCNLLLINGHNEIIADNGFNQFKLAGYDNKKDAEEALYDIYDAIFKGEKLLYTRP